MQVITDLDREFINTIGDNLDTITDAQIREITPKRLNYVMTEGKYKNCTLALLLATSRNAINFYNLDKNELLNLIDKDTLNDINKKHPNLLSSIQNIINIFNNAQNNHILTFDNQDGLDKLNDASWIGFCEILAQQTHLETLDISNHALGIPGNYRAPCKKSTTRISQLLLIAVPKLKKLKKLSFYCVDLDLSQLWSLLCAAGSYIKLDSLNLSANYGLKNLTENDYAALGIVKPPLTVPFKSRHQSKVASHIFPRRFVA